MSSIKKALAAMLFFGLLVGANLYARPHGPPPQEAFDACSGKAEGDSCAFKGKNDRDVEGECVVPKRGNESLICKPNRSRKPPKKDS